MADLRIAVAGCTGRMGRALLHEFATPAQGFVLSGALVRTGHVLIGTPVSDLATDQEDTPTISTTFSADAAAAFEASDVVLDFTSPTATLTHAELARTTGTALLVGTTGLGATEIEALEAASANAAVLIAPNTSLGVNLMLGFVRDAAAKLGPAFAISIDDLHHAAKKDAPSGTALALKQAAQQATSPDGSDNIDITSVREGDAAGTHTVTFEGPLETLQLTHCAKDRAIFAKGALVAARWLAHQKPGLYDMADMLADSARQ